MAAIRSEKKPVSMSISALKWVWAGVAFVLAFSSGCDLGSGPPPGPASIESFAGTDQTATVNQPVGVPPAVRILDTRGKPMSGKEVIFSVASGGGSVSQAVQLTDVEGVARVGSWTLGTTAGVHTLQATVLELPPYTFTATALAGAPATVTVQDGETQSGIVGSHAPVTPSVLVRDEFGNPAPDAVVEFEVTSGGGSVAGEEALTNGSGIARAGAWTLGTVPGDNSLSATVSGLQLVTFMASAAADQPAQITVLQGDQQTGTVGTVLPLSLTLSVADQFGNLLPGVPVAFEVEAGSGTLEGEAQATNGSGVASAGTWTLGTGAGPQSVLVVVNGVDPVTLSATATAGEPVSSSSAAGDVQVATAGTAVSVLPSVLVLDAFGNPVPGVGVTFAETETPESSGGAGGGTPPSGPNATTGPDGIAAVESWVLGTSAGAYELSAFISGIAEPVVFSATAVPDQPVIVTKTEGDNQTARIGTGVDVPPAVTVQDQYGNGVKGVAVEFLVAEGGGAISGATTSTDSNGRAAIGSWILGSVPGPNAVSATAVGVGVETFSATGLTAVPAAITKVAGDGQTAQVATSVGVQPQVRITDATGAPVSWVSVEFEVVSGGGSVTDGTVITDAAGLASVGTWTLGTLTGPQTIQAATEGLSPVVFSATSSPGPAASIAVGVGDGQSATTNTAVPVPPSVFVRDGYGNGVPAVPVTFTATVGGGLVTGSPVTTTSSGEATIGSWILGPTPGPNSLTATVAGVGSVSVQATGVAAVPAAITKTAGDNQTTEVGTSVSVLPQVRVTDSGGNPIPAIEVMFSISSGGGAVTGGTVLTDGDGRATVGSWTLGTTAGPNALEAATVGLPVLNFSASGTPGTSCEPREERWGWANRAR